MNNHSLAKIFDSFADIQELSEDTNRFIVRAFRQASLTLQNLPKDIAEYIDVSTEKFTTEIAGFGPALKSKTIEFIKTGKIREFEELKTTIPEGIFKMLELKNVGPKKVKKFYYELGITSVEELKKAIEEGKIEVLEGFGKKSAEKILEGINNFETYSKRTPLGEIYFDLKEIEQNMLACPYVLKAKICGSARRMQETIGDVDIVATGDKKNHPKIIEYFKKLPYIERIQNDGDTKVSGYLKSGPQIDFRIVKDDEYGAALQYFSGNQAHNVQLRTLSKRLGYKINEYGIFEIKSDKKVGGKTEEEIYAKLGLQFIPTELRQGNNEIEIAATSKIPKLIELKDIKGDLHAHSTYSDGKNSIEEMALAAKKLGYEYIAITDHSQSLKFAGGLDKERLKQKKKEIDALKTKLNFNILYGTEVDILQDGSIDYDDKTLSEFDIVIASIHVNLLKDTSNRILKAMQNPFVHIIGHPTTRMINKRPMADLNFKEIFKTARETGTILEINAQPLRMDLPDIYVREGKESYGLKFIIDTDAHATGGLGLMELGIGIARRGWLTKKDVINTLHFEEFMKALKR